MNQSQASQTAYIVARGVLHTIRKPHFSNLVDQHWEQTYTELLSSTFTGRKNLKQLDSFLYRQLFNLIEWSILPNIRLHYVLRKKYIEAYCREMIEQKAITQVVNLGAGFDSLTYRLSKEYTDIQFFEIDHPATQQDKSIALAQNPQFNKNLHAVPVDFTYQTADTELQQLSAFNQEQTTLFISEGVVMYLTEQHVIQLLDSIKKLSTGKHFFIFTAVLPMKKRGLRSFLLKHYLKNKSEPVLWLQTPETLEHFLNEQNYTLNKIVDSQYFRQHYLPSYHGYLQQSEYIAVTQSH